MAPGKSDGPGADAVERHKENFNKRSQNRPYNRPGYSKNIEKVHLAYVDNYSGTYQVVLLTSNDVI